MRSFAALTVLALLAAPASATAPVPPALALAIDGPDAIAVGETATFVVDLFRPRGSAPLPERVRLTFSADDVGPLEGPSEILLGPLDRCEGREETPCARFDFAYTPRRAGDRSLGARAEGDFAAAEAARAVDVARDPVSFGPGALGAPPDGEPSGPRPLRFRAATTRLAEADVNVTLHASWQAEGFPAVTWIEGVGARRLARAGSDVLVSFTPRWAAGEYTLTLVALGPDAEGASAPLRFAHAPAPAPARAAARVEAEVEDAPGSISLTSDSVNADGKQKAPGDAVVTRFTASDPNGLGDLGAILARVDRIGPARVPIAEARIALDPNRTKASLEHRFALSPLREGTYVINLSAERGRSTAAERTFVVTNAKPTLAGHALDRSRAFPAESVRIAGNVTLADRNFGTGPLDPEPAPAFRSLSAKLYRGSTLVTDPAWAFTLGGAVATGGRAVLDLSNATRAGPWPTYEKDGSGHVAIPLVIVVPAGAPTGDHHLSLYHAATATETPTLLGTVPFSVDPLPAVKTLVLSSTSVLPGDVVDVRGTLDPGARVDGVTIAWNGPSGPLVTVDLDRSALDDGSTFSARLVAPSPLAAGLATAVVATPLPAGVARAVAVKIANAPPSLAWAATVDGVAWGTGPARVLPGPARLLEVALAARDPNDAEPTVAFTARLVDWNGATVAGATRIEGATNATAIARVALPPDLPAGRYMLLATARDEGGATGTCELALEVGAWVAASLPSGRIGLDPVPGGLAGATPLALAGNVRVGAVHVLLAPLASARTTLAPTGVAVSIVGSSGAVLASGIVDANASGLRLGGLDLAPGEVATLRLDWPTPVGTPGGRYEGFVAIAVEARA